MRIIPSSALAIAVLMTASPSMAADPAQVAQLNQSGKCPKCDLSGADLSFANLTGANLIGANLSGTNLRGATLEGADLSGANLAGVNLKFSHLKNANLKGANLIGAKYCRTTMPDGKLRHDDCNR